MKLKNILYITTGLLLVIATASCNKILDDEPGNDEFEIPELTLSNTIQFTVNANTSRSASFLLHGGKVAVDWGDGEITKRIDPGTGELWRSEFEHTYRKTGQYRVKIYSDQVSFINLSSLLKDYEELHVGNCPILTDADFNSFAKDRTINLNGCKELKILTIGNWEQLESITMDECSQLQNADIYSHPKLTKLDLSKNSKLVILKCDYCTSLEELSVHPNISQIVCSYSKLASISLRDYKKLNIFHFKNNNNLASINLSGCTNLYDISFSNTSVASFDFSPFTSLGTLSCANLGLTTLNVSKNTGLRSLNCSENKLTELDLSNNKALSQVFINKNELGKDALNSIFNQLPSRTGFNSWGINLLNNPGTETCDTKIIANKGWTLMTK